MVGNTQASDGAILDRILLVAFQDVIPHEKDWITLGCHRKHIEKYIILSL